MKKILYIFFVGIVMGFTLPGCQKDLPFPTNTDPNLPPFNPKPYTIKVPDHFPKLVIPPDNPMTKEGVNLGRFIFFDTITSADLTMSCASCHSIDFGFTDSGKKLSSGIFGMEGKRNSMPLFNLGFEQKFFWDGRANTLEEQILMPIQDHLELAETLPNLVAKLKAHPEYPNMFYAAFGTKDITPQLAAKAVAQFLRTIVSGDSKYDRVVVKQSEFFEDDEARGYQLFNDLTGGDCFHCHGEGNRLFGDFMFRNNALDSATTIVDFKDPGRGGVTGKPEDYGAFKTPSLRNVAVTAPYMHDGRLATLDEVLEHYKNLKPSINVNQPDFVLQMNKGGIKLTTQEKSDIIAFLKTLTDTSFVNDPMYQNPFKN